MCMQEQAGQWHWLHPLAAHLVLSEGLLHHWFKANLPVSERGPAGGAPTTHRRQQVSYQQRHIVMLKILCEEIEARRGGDVLWPNAPAAFAHLQDLLQQTATHPESEHASAVLQAVLKVQQLCLL